MGISFTIYQEQAFFVSTWIGNITDSDLLSSYKDLYANEKFKPGFHEIADLRKAQLNDVTSDGMSLLVEMMQRYLTEKCDDFKTAVIAPDNISFGMSRVYKSMSYNSPENVEVFRELNEALKWIGIDESFLE